MTIFYLISSCLTLAYWVFFEKRRQSWYLMTRKASTDAPLDLSKKCLPLSVIIPFRNERHNLPGLLETLLKQSHTDCEFIFVDDQSDDGSSELIKAYKDPRFRLISDPQISGKKEALRLGIEAANYAHIVCTDADVTAGQSWLEHMARGFDESHIQFISGPVQFSAPDHFWGRWLQLEFAALVATGGASMTLMKPNMCNGANLAFKKQAWNKAMPTQSGKHLNTGDDLFLMHRIAELYPRALKFLFHKEARVFTEAPDTLTSFFSQRIRWASKSGTYKGMRLKLEPIIIWLFSSLILISFVFAIFRPMIIWAALLMLGIKSITDYRFFRVILPFFDGKTWMQKFMLSEIVHILYIFITGILASFGAYSWKGRNAKHK